ncbi:MAG TPA: molybdate ABC transporter substrate-binding protein, partial [Isosphaeraceae bacterium]|nr:molybdate ABC transporter substrate-binding protein [Isosphaeraceae bacterium]
MRLWCSARKLPAIVSCLLLITTHVAADEPKTSPASRSVTIYAAASTSDAVRAATEAFARSTGAKVTTSFGSSSTLAHQVAQGAPADLFLSAATEWGKFLADRGEVAEQIDLLSNRLVVIVPADNPAGVRSTQDLKRPEVERLALGDPEHVPAGKYGREALERLGLWQDLRGRVVAADDVREALAYVARGEVQAGIVYETDAAAEPSVKVVARFDPALHAPIRYPLVLLKRAAGNPAARQLFAYLRSDEAAAVFQKRGFTRLRTERAGPAATSVPPSPRAEEPEWLGLTAVERTAVVLSLWVAGWAVVISLPPAVAIGYWLARKRFRGKAAVETLVNLALVLPPVVTGYLLLVVLGRRGWVGGWLDRWLGLQIAFTWKAAALASAVVSFPLMVRAIRLSFQGVDAR